MEVFSLFESTFAFIFDFLSIDILGTYSILDVMAFGIIAMAIVRLLVLPAFGKFGGFGSSSAERRRQNNTSEDD